MPSQWLAIFITSVLMFLAFLGAILPLVPGPPLAFAGLLLYGFWTHFRAVTITALIIFGALTLLTIIFDIFAPALAAKGYKASRYGVIGALVGAILGMFVLGPFGIILGPFVGGFLGEYLAKSDPSKAIRTAWGTFVGFLVGTIFKFIVTLAMVGYFLYLLAFAG